MRRRLLLPALAAAAVLACFREPDPTDLGELAVSVHAVLEAGADSAVVLIFRPPSAGDPFGPPDPVSGAEVRLVADGQESWLTEDPAVDCGPGRDDSPERGLGCYRATLPSPIEGGGAYALEIRLPDGSVVTGETVVPTAREITRPVSGDAVVVECNHPDRCFGENIETFPYIVPVVTLPVAWAPAAAAESIELAVISMRVYLDGAEHPGEMCRLGFGSVFGFAGTRIFDDSASWAIPNITCTFAPGAHFDSIRADVVLTVLNDAYRTYREDAFSAQTVRERSASMGLEGAYGVFGAVAPSRRSLLLVRDPPPADPGTT